MMIKKYCILVSFLLILALLAGCGSAGVSEKAASGAASGSVQTSAEDKVNSAVASLNGQTDKDSKNTGTVWQAKFLPLQGRSLNATLQNGTVLGDRLYFTSMGVIADETPEGETPDWPEQYWIYGPVLLRVGLDGSTETVAYSPDMPEKLPGVNSGVLFEGLYAAPDETLWILENHYRLRSESGATEAETPVPETVENSTDDAEDGETKLLVHIREDGTVLQRISIQELAVHKEEAAAAAGTYSFSVTGFAVDRDGNLCLAVHEWYSGKGSFVQDNRIFILDSETGALKTSIPTNGELAYMTRLNDGRIAAMHYEGATPVIGILDDEGKELVDTATVTDFMTSMLGGTGSGELYYGAGDSLYRMNLDEISSEKLFDWTACDVAHSDDDSVCVLSDGRIVTSRGERSGDAIQNELVILTPVDASSVPEKKVLQMAVLNLYPFTSKMVSSFNRQNTEYRIEVTDYSQYNNYSSGDPEDWNAGLTRLQTELIAGNVPDILDISLLPVSRLEEKGLLVDLLPYIDADPELSLSQLNTHVLKAFEQNGKLFQTVGNFYVLTTAGLSEYVGEKMGWTMADFNKAMQRLQAEHPESTVFDIYTTRDDALTFLLYLEMENYVDWSTGNCYFDTDGFRELLSFVRSFPTAFDWDADVTAKDLDQDARLAYGLQLMKQCNFVTFEDVQKNTLGLGGAPCTFVGYPTEHGVGSMFAQIGNSFAISSGCADKEAAWQFIREFFLPSYQNQFKGNVFPTNLQVYEEMKREAMTAQYERNPDGSYVLDDEGQRIEADRGTVEVGGMSVKLGVVTQAECDLIEQIIGATEHVLSTDSSLKDIIVSGAAGFFSDQRSVEEVVQQIQSRANLYVNEQR